MKPLKLTIKNIGAIADETVSFDWPLIVFYGEPKAGKSTILNCVRWVMGGAFPSDIIRHGAKEGSIELRFEGGSVSRSFYRNKGLGLNCWTVASLLAAPYSITLSMPKTARQPSWPPS